MELSQFDDIRSFNNDEIKIAFSRITKQKEFCSTMQYIFPQQPMDNILTSFLQLNNIDEFQRKIIYPYLLEIVKKYTDGITVTGLNTIKTTIPSLFISNHRDIILDSAFLCKSLLENGMDTVEIAIGDNLLVYPWIEDFVRANKSFIVKRGGGVRELLAHSQHLSDYIRYTLLTKKSSVWMAQREGRAKDSNDRTQTGILKMLNMSGNKTFLENIKDLNICPLAISYEYDPCDYLKAQEFQQKRDNPSYHKTQKDDLLNMQMGVMGKKGKIMFHFTPSINESLKDIAQQTEVKNIQIDLLAKLIDKQIHQHYAIYANNKIAYDLLKNTSEFVQEYTADEKEIFENYIQQQISKINLPNKDNDFLRQKMLEMYANPLINKIASIGN